MSLNSTFRTAEGGIRRAASAVTRHVFCCLLTGMLLLGAVYLLTVLWMYQQQDALRQREWREMISDLYARRTAESGQNLQTLLLALSGNPELLRPFLARDRAALLQAALPLNRHLSRQSQITHFYFHDPDKTCFLRVHQPDRHGDRVSRIILDQAAATEQTAAGI